jgi:hypothetical protein
MSLCSNLIWGIGDFTKYDRKNFQQSLKSIFKQLLLGTYPTMEIDKTFIDELILYHSITGLVICRLCKSAMPDDIQRHLQDFHNTLTPPEKIAVVHHLNSLLERRSIKQITTEYVYNVEVEAIEGLPIISGFKCERCGLLGAKSTIKKHCEMNHAWTTSQSNIFQCLS